MTLIDAAYLIALINPRDALHDRAPAWSRATLGALGVTDHVLEETLNFYSPGDGRLRAHAVVGELLRQESVEMLWTDSSRFRAALDLYAARQDKAWSLTDCISFLVMQEHGMEQAFTYDRHFEQAGFRALLRSDPA